METPEEWNCQWDVCAQTFQSESDLFVHLRTHASNIQPITCKWRTCVNSPIYIHRGHLNDHITSHMSGTFCGLNCAGCRTPFKNRQSLYRHQKLTDCSGRYVTGDIYIPEPSKPTYVVNFETSLILKNALSLSKGIVVRERSLDTIIREQSQGIMSFPLISRSCR
jgi:hypothetical protein